MDDTNNALVESQTDTTSVTNIQIGHRQLNAELGQRLGQSTNLRAKNKKNLAPFDAKSLIDMVCERIRTFDPLHPIKLLANPRWYMHV